MDRYDTIQEAWDSYRADVLGNQDETVARIIMPHFLCGANAAFVTLANISPRLKYKHLKRLHDETLDLFESVTICTEDLQ